MNVVVNCRVCTCIKNNGGGEIFTDCMADYKIRRLILFEIGLHKNHSLIRSVIFKE